MSTISRRPGTKYHNLKCPECEETEAEPELHDLGSLEDHLARHHLTDFWIYKCPRCSEAFVNHYRAKKHLDFCYSTTPLTAGEQYTRPLHEINREEMQKIKRWTNVAVKNYAREERYKARTRSTRRALSRAANITVDFAEEEEELQILLEMFEPSAPPAEEEEEETDEEDINNNLSDRVGRSYEDRQPYTFQQPNYSCYQQSAAPRQLHPTARSPPPPYTETVNQSNDSCLSDGGYQQSNVTAYNHIVMERAQQIVTNPVFPNGEPQRLHNMAFGGWNSLVPPRPLPPRTTFGGPIRSVFHTSPVAIPAASRHFPENPLSHSTPLSSPTFVSPIASRVNLDVEAYMQQADQAEIMPNRDEGGVDGLPILTSEVNDNSGLKYNVPETMRLMTERYPHHPRCNIDNDEARTCDPACEKKKKLDAILRLHPDFLHQCEHQFSKLASQIRRVLNLGEPVRPPRRSVLNSEYSLLQ